MKLEDIKNMSDEEFTKWLDGLKIKYSKYVEVDPEVEEKAVKKVRNVMSLFSGLGISAIGIHITDLFAIDFTAEEFPAQLLPKLLVCAVAFLGGFLGSRKLIDIMLVACTELAEEGRRNTKINIKNNLERLSQEDLEFLISLPERKNVLELHNNLESDLSRALNISANDLLNEFQINNPTKFTDANLNNGHSKTMNKND